jgi:preprotein translocase SecE subunit
MASVTKGDEENRAAAQDDDAGAGNGTGAKKYPAKSEKPEKSPKAAKDGGESRALEYERTPARPRGYFTIYKKGQGYWTRIGTVVGAGILGAMLAYTLYDRIQVFFTNDPRFGKRLAIGVAAGFIALYSLLVWHLVNKPSNVDFLVSTDSEMKKVNWTSRKELIGSTKVVIFFMFLIAVILFALDRIIGALMYLIGVLKNPWWGGGG